MLHFDGIDLIDLIDRIEGIDLLKVIELKELILLNLIIVKNVWFATIGTFIIGLNIKSLFAIVVVI